MSAAPDYDARVFKVFGTGRELPESYVARAGPERQLAAALDGDGHVVVWGEPRLGKSALIRRHLGGREYAVIGCSYGQRRYDVYRMLLREAGASVAVERKRRRARGIGAKVSILSGDLKSESETTERAFDIDISNVNDVLRVIEDNGFRKIVVLDDFHYLGRGAQRNIVQDLKLIYEKSELRVILVGVWADRSRLRELHSDLAGRLDAVEVRRWTDEELLEVLERGRRILGVEFTDVAAQLLVRRSQQSVGLFQDLTRATLVDAPGGATVSGELVDLAVQHVLENSIGRLRWYVSRFANPTNRVSGDAQPFKGILHALLIASDEGIRGGISADSLIETVRELYPFEAADLTNGDMLAGLNRISSAHRALRANPVLGYDAAGGTLQVVDPLVRLFLTSADEESLIPYLPDEGRDIETDTAEFDRRVLELYGEACAVCSTTERTLLEVVRLRPPPRGAHTAPEYGLPLCLNHVLAWQGRLMRFDPETTQVVCLDPGACGVTRPDLTHLPARPSGATLQYDWETLGTVRLREAVAEAAAVASRA